MPIIVKDFNWKQTRTSLTIQIPLKRISQSKVDLIISSRFIKASYEQYHFEVILLTDIDEKNSKCTLTATDIIFELAKKNEGEWETLEPILTKAEKFELKKTLLEEYYKTVQQQSEDLVNKKAELKRVAVRKQIKTDTEIRNNIDNVKKKEEEIALGDIGLWKKAMVAKLKPIKPKKVVQKIEKEEKCEVIQPRKSQILEIEFTPRVFPTPCRESRMEEEDEWLKMQAAARRSCGFISEDIRPEERNPQFLKAKGDEFLKNKNYLGAISAYSFGIKISPKFVDFYISRSEAHLELGNFHKTIQDCSTAVDLMKPACPSNLKERATCIGRRGIALCKIGMKKQGIDELAYSLNLVPDEKLEEFLDAVEDEE